MFKYYKKYVPYLFILPAMVILTVFFFIPFFQTIGLSFYDYSNSIYSPSFVGVQNYVDIMHSPLFYKVMGNTFLFLILAVPFLVIFPLFLAVLINQKIRGITLYKILIYLPVIVSIVVAAIAFKWLYAQEGILNYFVTTLGLKPIGWLTDTRFSMLSVAIVTIWKGVGYYMMIYLAALMSVPQELYEASTIIPELKESDGTTDIATYAPKRVTVSTAVGTLLPAGEYVVDAVEGNTGQYKVYPVENVPYEHTYTTHDTFFEDDGAGQWVYEYNIPHGDEILSVEETTIPEYYQKIDSSTNASGQTVYNITNSMESRNLVIEKKTEDDEPGLFEYGVKFYLDTDTSKRHPVKVGHTQIIKDKDGEGKDIYEYEIYFENGVTYSGKDVSGLNEIIIASADNFSHSVHFNISIGGSFIERFSGESPSEMLIAPNWCGERDRIIAEVEKLLD